MTADPSSRLPADKPAHLKRAERPQEHVRAMARRMLRARAEDAQGLIRDGDVSEVAQACFDARLGKISAEDVLLIVDHEARKLGL